MLNILLKVLFLFFSLISCIRFLIIGFLMVFFIMVVDKYGWLMLWLILVLVSNVMLLCVVSKLL